MIKASSPDKNKRTILIIDDSEIEREVAKGILQDKYNILEAQNGREGLGILKSNYGLITHLSTGKGHVMPSDYTKIEAVISDIVMPVMDGHEFLKKVKTIDELKEIPIIVATSLDATETEIDCINEGAMDLISKPYNPMILRARINNMLTFKDNIKAVSLLKYDSLTGFRNRTEYYRDIETIENSPSRRKKPIGIVFADINGLKQINDRKGHETGDKLIKSIATNIKVVFGDKFTYRLDGDEFVAFSFDNNEEAFNKKLEILDQLWTEVASASVGSIWLNEAKNLEHNIFLADKKMYIAKNQFYGRKNSNDGNGGDFSNNFAKLSENMPGGLIVYHADENQEIIHVNSEAVSLLGYDNEEEFRIDIHDSFVNVVHPDDLQALNEDISSQLNSRSKLIYTEYRILCNGKECKKVSDYRRHVYLDKYGDVYFSFINDIQKEFDYGETGLINQLDQARKVAEEASNAKSRFLYNMSHDIRTPMNAIVGYTHLAMNNIKDEKLVSEYLNKMDFAESNLMALVNNILEMSSIESDRMVINEKPIDIMPALDKIGVFIEEQCKSRNIKVRTYMDVKHRYFYQDQERNGEVTINIISNAIKYTPKGGTIQYGLRELPGEKPDELIIEFTCSDSGVGMSKEFLERAFDSFERERKLNSTWQGNGLGLAIVKKLVERMDGHVEIISEEGVGTTVKTYTPHKICTKEEYDKYMDDHAPQEVDISGKYILLVDDNELNLEITSEILVDRGVIVEAASSGREACNKLLEKGPGYYDAIMMDIQMPVMDGLETTRIIRKLDNEKLATTPIIALSAHAFDVSEKEAFNAGMNGYVSKPINVDHMLATLSKVMYGR